MPEPQADVENTEETAQGYPTLAQVLRAINDEDTIPDVGVRRIEINAFASGDATYRVWTVAAEEAEGGYIDQL